LKVDARIPGNQSNLRQQKIHSYKKYAAAETKIVLILIHLLISPLISSPFDTTKMLVFMVIYSH
jgi:hypothetical protein